jgi:zinc protease
MKRTILILLTAGAILALGATAGIGQDISKLKFPPLNELKMPSIERVTLDNGLRLYLCPDKSLPVFHMSVRINCGSFLEPADKIGLAAVCGTVLRTGGTAKWTGDQIDELLESVGGSVEASIGLSSGSVSVNVLSDYTDLGLEVLGEILRRPVFNEDKIELAKVQQRSAISRRNDEPMQIAVREFTKIIYGAESVFARQREYKTINAITRDDLVAFHGKYFKPQNVQMAVWGDFDRAKLLAAINRFFADWQKEGEVVPPLPKVEYKYDNRVFFAKKEDIPQSNVVIGHIGGLVTDPDYAARIVMNTVLGGSFASRLNNAVRTREGLAYTTFAEYGANISYPGAFYCFVSTKTETTVKAIREIIKQVKGMQTNPPDVKEMRLGKDGYLNSFVFNFDDKGEVINRMMAYDFYGLPEDFLFKEKDQVEKVLPADVVEAAKKNLHPEALRILVVGQSSGLDVPLSEAGLGPLTELDITIPSGEEKKELTATPENLAKGKELLAKAAAAAGGVANHNKIKATAIKGTVTIVTPQGDLPLAVEEITVFPDKNRAVASFMGQKLYNTRNGAGGWKSDQTGQLVPKTPEDIKEQDDENARNTILIFQKADKPDFQVVYDGSGESNGVRCEYVVLLGPKGDRICRLGFDAGTYDLVSRAYWGKTMMGEGNVEELFSTLSETSGIKIPMKTVVNLNGQKISVFDVTEVVANGDYPASTFDKPE